jgi:hypothetical protein
MVAPAQDVRTLASGPGPWPNLRLSSSGGSGICLTISNISIARLFCISACRSPNRCHGSSLTQAAGELNLQNPWSGICSGTSSHAPAEARPVIPAMNIFAWRALYSMGREEKGPAQPDHQPRADRTVRQSVLAQAAAASRWHRAQITALP